MRVLIAGASGLIGQELCRQLDSAGHTPVRLVRREALGKNEIRWEPGAHVLDANVLNDIDAIVNLSGASLARLPWNPSYRTEILQSRLSATSTLTDAMFTSSTPPKILLNGSAVGVYGDRPGELLGESSASGTDFLADVTTQWEAAAAQAPDETRVVMLRTGLVLAKAGALKPVLPLAKLGLAGPLGTGEQHWAWISLHDEAAAIVHLLTSSLSGAVNLVGPNPATSNEILRALATALNRPFFLAVPRPILEFLLQDAARQLLLADQKVSAQTLLDDGFEFAHRTPATAIAWMLRQP